MFNVTFTCALYWGNWVLKEWTGKQHLLRAASPLCWFFFFSPFFLKARINHSAAVPCLFSCCRCHDVKLILCYYSPPPPQCQTAYMCMTTLSERGADWFWACLKLAECGFMGKWLRFRTLPINMLLSSCVTFHFYLDRIFFFLSPCIRVSRSGFFVWSCTCAGDWYPRSEGMEESCMWNVLLRLIPFTPVGNTCMQCLYLTLNFPSLRAPTLTFA